MSPDPFRARGWPRVNRETRTPLEDFTVRLRALGATPDEVDAVVASWDDVEDERDAAGDPTAWTAKRRDEVARLPDAQLRAMIEDGRQEYAYGTTTQEEADRQAAVARERRTYAEAAERVNGTVASILAWVGDDPLRALAIRDAEVGPGGGKRKTLLTALEPIHGGPA